MKAGAIVFAVMFALATQGRIADDGGATLFREEGSRTFDAGRYAGRKIMLPPDCAEISVVLRMRTDGVV